MPFEATIFPRLTQWIARTAFHMNGAVAVLLGMGVILLVAVPPLAVVLGTISEPYPDLTTYLAESVKALPPVVISVLVLGGAVIGALFQYRYRALDSDLDARVYCVSLLPLAVIYVPWAILASLKIISHPSNGFVPAINRPTWLDIWPIRFFETPHKLKARRTKGPQVPVDRCIPLRSHPGYHTCSVPRPQSGPLHPAE